MRYEGALSNAFCCTIIHCKYSVSNLFWNSAYIFLFLPAPNWTISIKLFVMPSSLSKTTSLTAMSPPKKQSSTKIVDVAVASMQPSSSFTVQGSWASKEISSERKGEGKTLKIKLQQPLKQSSPKNAPQNLCFSKPGGGKQTNANRVE